MENNEKNNTIPNECNTANEENAIKDKSTEPGFKKPLLVGKIGRLPKKLKNPQTEISTQEIPHETPKEIEKAEVENVSKPENTQQKSDTFSLQYKEPVWAGMPKSTAQSYNFEILKDGSIIDKVDLMEKSFWVFGRLANCDITMQHPTISRYHAVLQYRTEPDEKNGVGFYIYDLGSTHGTFLNKNKLRPRVYVRIQVGHILKLGCSTRNYLLNGPDEDTEEESELTVTELKQKRKEEIEKREREKLEEIERMKKEEEERKKKEEERGIDWGLGEDADEEMDLSENPYASSNNEELYLDDPKKTLRGFFEREGLNLEYDCSEQGMGQFLCKVELPIDDEKGRPMHAEVIHKGKKKEAVVQCALEACRILDRYGMLRQAVHESRKRKARDWAENDYYDSDDDTFLDRTGEIEKKREKRMNSKNPQKAETYESLIVKEREIAESIRKLETQLLETQEKSKSSKNTTSEEDSLDAFMKNLKDSKPDKTVISKLRSELAKLKQEHSKVIKLVNMVKPASLPPLVAQYNSEVTNQDSKSKVLPIFGKRKKVPVLVPQKTSTIEKMDVDDDDEEEEEKTEEPKMNTDIKVVIDEGNVNVEPQKTEEVAGENEKSQRKYYGLQKPEEIVEHKNRSNVAKDESVEGTCRKLLSRVFDKVKLLSKQISSIQDTETKNKESDNLNSIVTSRMELLLEDLDKVEIKNPTEIEEIQVQEETGKIEEIKEIETTTDEASKKKKNQRRIQQRQEKAEIEKKKGYAEDARKEDYNMWIPPKGQTGDGRTKLNEKFGY